jgi:polysaccharide export outer membrane protein
MIDAMKSPSYPFLRAGLVLCAAAILAACGSTPERPPLAPDTVGMSVQDYRIGVDDLVSVTVWRNDDLNVVVPVRPDGRISVPLIGDVAAGGRTPQEVADDIEEKLGVYVRDPQVAVILTELRSHEYLSRVRVTGAVRDPISLPYRQGMTVLDAVLAAGGPTEFAAQDRTQLHRRGDEGSRSYAVPLASLLERGDLTANFPVQPGDVITVPERVF